MPNPKLDKLLSRIIDRIDVDAIFKCGGEGSGVPGPCPDSGPEPKPGNRSASRSGKDRGKDRRSERQPPPAEPRTSEHEQNVKASQHLAQTTIDNAVREGRISEEQGREFGSQLSSLIKSMPEKAMKRFVANTKGYEWHADTDSVTRAYFAPNPPDMDEGAGAFYDAETQILHLDDNSLKDYAEEMAHAIDGPDYTISSSNAWIAAYKRERHNWTQDPYRMNSPREWWADLASVYLAQPEMWKSVSYIPGLKGSVTLVERHLNG